MISREEPWPSPQKFWWWALAFVAVWDSALMFYWFVRWQNNLRDLAGVERIGYDVIPEIIGVAVVVFLLLMFIGKLWGAATLWVVHTLGKLIRPASRRWPVPRSSWR